MGFSKKTCLILVLALILVFNIAFLINSSGTVPTLAFSARFIPNDTTMTEYYFSRYVEIEENNGGALSFNGSNYVEITDAPTLDLNNSYTFEGWFRNTSNVNGNTVLISHHRIGYGICILSTNTFGISVRHVNSVGADVTVYYNTPVFDGAWHHIVVTYDVPDVMIYVDGISVHNGSRVLGVYQVAQSTQIGGSSGENYFTGVIDEVRIYNRSISLTEIVFSYASGVGFRTPLNQAGLCVWMHFDELVGSIAYDETANSNDGVITGASWVGGHVPAISSLTFEDGALKINNDWINSTLATYNSIRIENWFNEFGFSFTSTKSDYIILFISVDGEPSRVNGATSTYNATSKQLNLTVSANNQVTVHWGSGGSGYLFRPDLTGFAHSWASYRTCFGFGIKVGTSEKMHGKQRMFFVTVYDNQSDLTRVELDIGTTITIRYDFDTEEFTEISDPYEYFMLRNAICEAKYEASTKIWTIGFGGIFETYSPRMELQNLTVTSTSTLEGNTENINFGAWFVYEPVVEWHHDDPIIVPWELMTPMLGVCGIVGIIACPYLALTFWRRHDLDKLPYIFVLALVSIGLIVVWLWA